MDLPAGLPDLSGVFSWASMRPDDIFVTLVLLAVPPQSPADGHDDETTAIVVVALFVLACLYMVFKVVKGDPRARLQRRIQECQQALSEPLQYFEIEVCPKCAELRFVLEQVSEAGRSIKVKCCTCGKTQWAKATSKAALQVAEMYATLQQLKDEMRRRYGLHPVTITTFTLAPPPLPFRPETGRQPIPPAAKTEVWRRDGGRCVECGGQEDLEFDHIIPLSKGGATTARNLQLLCAKCNRKKAAMI